MRSTGPRRPRPSAISSGTTTCRGPAAGAGGSAWCLGPGDPNQPCCFLSRQQPQPNTWLVQPANPDRVAVSGTVVFDNGTPAANQKYLLIAPDGEFLHTDAAGQPDLAEHPAPPNS